MASWLRLSVFWCVAAMATPVWASTGHGTHPVAVGSGTFSNQVTASTPEVKPSHLMPVAAKQKITLKASIVKEMVNGKPIKRLAYNGMIPGPQIRVQQGDSIEVELVNDTDVPTTLHSHGVRLDYRFDGVPGVGKQKPIPPGGRFTYHLSFPDAGIYWYHPHIREDYGQTLGLYGVFEVLPKDPAYYPKANKEQVLILSDLLLNDKQQPPAFYRDRANFALMGRFGNRLLVNNQTALQQSYQTGDVVRLFLVNVANTRTFRLSIPGVKLKRIAADASLYEQETWEDEIVLAPSERLTVDVQFAKPGSVQLVHRSESKTEPLVTFAIDKTKAQPDLGTAFTTLRRNDAVTVVLKPLRARLADQPDKTLELTVDVQGPMASHHHPTAGGPVPIEWEDGMFAMNQDSHSREIQWRFVEPKTGKINMDINWVFKRGDLTKIRVVNRADSAHPMQHPIHFHGNRFVVLSRDGVAQENLAWKDSALVKTGETMDVVLENANPGEWMGHCHIAEHLTSGMMFGFQVKN